MLHAINSSNEGEAGGCIFEFVDSLFYQDSSGQPGLYTETLSYKKHKKVSWYELTINEANSASGSKWRIHQN